MNQYGGGSHVFGRILGEPFRKLPLLIGVILKGKCAIEHIAEDDRGQKETGIFHHILEIALRVVIYPNSTSRLGSWLGAKCCLINNVNSMRYPDIHFK